MPVLPAPGDPLTRADAPAGVFLSRQGTWYEDGEAVTHPKLAALWSRSIARAADGSVVLTTGRDVRAFAAEDAVYAVRAIVDGAFALSDGTRDAPVDGVILVDAAGVMRARVKGGAWWAVLTRGAAHAIGALLDDDGVAIRGAGWRLVEDDAARDWTASP